MSTKPLIYIQTSATEKCNLGFRAPGEDRVQGCDTYLLTYPVQDCVQFPHGKIEYSYSSNFIFDYENLKEFLPIHLYGYYLTPVYPKLN